MSQVKLPLETMQKIMQYLSYQPYNQVADLVSEIHKSAEQVNPEKVTAKKSKAPLKIDTKAKKELEKAASK